MIEYESTFCFNLGRFHFFLACTVPGFGGEKNQERKKKIIFVLLLKKFSFTMSNSKKIITNQAQKTQPKLKFNKMWIGKIKIKNRKYFELLLKKRKFVIVWKYESTPTV